MKSVIAQRCSGCSAARNPGIGGPLNPGLLVPEVVPRDAPPRNVQLCVRFAARIEWLQSSFRVGAEGPSPRPSVPWHFTHPLSSYSFFPSVPDSFVTLGALGSGTGFGTISGLAKSAEKLSTK